LLFFASQLATHVATRRGLTMLWLGALKKRSTLSCEATKAMAIVYAREAILVIVSNPWCVVAVERSAGPSKLPMPDVFCRAILIDLLLLF
jgi:hypothetical protein